MEKIFLSFLEISLSIGIIILLIGAVSSVADKKLNPKWKYWVWLLIALRLVIPYTPEIDINMAEIEFAVPDKTVYYVPAVEAEEETIGPIKTHQGAAELGINVVMPSPDDAEKPVGEQEERVYTVLDILGGIWIFGGAAFFIWYVGAYFVFRSKTLKNAHPADEKTAGILFETKEELGIKKNIEAAVSKNITSPMVMGFIKPKLLLPEEDYGERELYFILRHELTHYKRRDTLYKALLLMANTLHWFNPAVWYMRKTAGTDLELSCDAAVIKGGDMEFRKEYSKTILASVHRERTACTVFSTHFYGGAKTLKKRFANILSTEKRKKGILAFVIVVIAAAMIGSVIVCTADKDMPTEKEVIELLQKAEAIYQPGNREILKVSRLDVYGDNGYYDEISNFEEVSKVFSEKGRQQLFTWMDGGNDYAFYEEDGKFFRQSRHTAEDTNLYYADIDSVELVDSDKGSFVYRIEHTQKSALTGEEKFISYAVIVKEKTKFFLEEFDSKRYEKQDIDENPVRTEGPVPEEEQIIALILKAEAVYQPGNTEVLLTKSSAMKPFSGWPFGEFTYDVAENYSEAVSQVFSKRGRLQLENTKRYGYQVFSPIIEQGFDHEIPPLIAKRFGKVFRLNKASAGVGATYYDDIVSIELIKELDGYFVYNIVHRAKTETGEIFDVVSTVDFVYENEKLLINDIFSNMEQTFIADLED